MAATAPECDHTILSGLVRDNKSIQFPGSDCTSKNMIHLVAASKWHGHGSNAVPADGIFRGWYNDVAPDGKRIKVNCEYDLKFTAFEHDVHARAFNVKGVFRTPVPEGVVTGIVTGVAVLVSINKWSVTLWNVLPASALPAVNGASLVSSEDGECSACKSGRMVPLCCRDLRRCQTCYTETETCPSCNNKIETWLRT
eukprot:6577-Heterococcus_DN1.PRE.8